MDIQKIIDIMECCSDLDKLAKESVPKARRTQLDTIIFNNFSDLSTIEQLYVGMEIAVSSLKKIVEFSEEDTLKAGKKCQYPKI
jgi:hypothetical protein